MATTRYFLCKNFDCWDPVDEWFCEWSARGKRKKSKCPSCEEYGELLLRQMRCSNRDCKKFKNARRRWIVSASPSQCNECKEDGELVPLGEETGVFTCKFLCDCTNEYNVRCKMTNTAECYSCDEQDVQPYTFCSREIIKKTNNKHSCSECRGRGECPNLT